QALFQLWRKDQTHHDRSARHALLPEVSKVKVKLCTSIGQSLPGLGLCSLSISSEYGRGAVRDIRDVKPKRNRKRKSNLHLLLLRWMIRASGESKRKTTRPPLTSTARASIRLLYRPTKENA